MWTSKYHTDGYVICTRNCISLIVDPTFSHTLIGPLCTMPACYWSNYFSIITFSKYENRKTKPKQILARTCPGKIAHMVTLLSTKQSNVVVEKIWGGRKKIFSNLFSSFCEGLLHFLSKIIAFTRKILHSLAKIFVISCKTSWVRTNFTACCGSCSSVCSQWSSSYSFILNLDSSKLYEFGLMLKIQLASQ